MKVLSSKSGFGFIILGLLVFCFGLFAQDGIQPMATVLEGESASEAELVRRQETLIRSQQLIRSAQSASAAGDYAKALDLYQSAQKTLVLAPGTFREKEEINKGMAGCYYALARMNYDQQQYAEAMEQAQQAYQLDPGNREALALSERAAKANERDTSHKKKEVKIEPPKEISNEAFIAKQRKIVDLYRAYENYYKSEQFDEAEDALKQITEIDPYSATAYHKLREVQAAKGKKLNAAKNQTETELLLEVQKRWQLPSRKDRLRTPGSESTNGDYQGKKKEIENKLDSIILGVNFVETSLSGVITYLMEESRKLDKTGKGEKGINIFIQDPVKASKTTDGTPYTPLGSKTVSLTLNPLALRTIIKFVTQGIGARAKIDPDAVIITPEGEDTTAMVIREFPANPGIFQAPTTSSSGGLSPSGGLSSPFDSSTTGGKSTVIDAKKSLEEFGIPFPPGSSAVYKELFATLVVKNTEEALDQIARLLYKLNNTTKQVLIETKFIDIRDSNVDELGFRWAFGPSTQQEFTVESGQGGNLASSIAVGGPYRGLANQMQNNRNGSSIPGNSIDTLLSTIGSTTLAGGVNTALTITGVLTNPQFQVMIDALARKGLTNLLSSPRVTTINNSLAKILVTREFIYPSSYSEPQATAGSSSSSGGSGGSGVAIAAPSPNSWASREVGVILEVTPQVGPDNRTISLNLSPNVVDFDGFVSYNTYAVAGSASFLFTLQQPIFSKRSLTTNVTIWDGETVVLGGLIREDKNTINDKIPFLGDIPLLGRFFQSKFESLTKRNLVIFVNAQIVDPGGNPIMNQRKDTIISPPSVE